MESYVVDASVILKWVLGDGDEPDQAKAVELLTGWAEGRDELYAPALWEFEVANFLGREFPDEADNKMEILQSLGIRNVALTEAMIRRCFAWMKTKKVTFYDASYLAAASEIGATLVTADERFVKKMGRNEPLMVLKDLG
jgi:predicted nucleic acid-binding protein